MSPEVSQHPQSRLPFPMAVWVLGWGVVRERVPFSWSISPLRTQAYRLLHLSPALSLGLQSSSVSWQHPDHSQSTPEGGGNAEFPAVSGNWADSLGGTGRSSHRAGCLILALSPCPCAPDLAQLRKKFEEDKQRIELMRAQRKFRPY